MYGFGKPTSIPASGRIMEAARATAESVRQPGVFQNDGTLKTDARRKWDIDSSALNYTFLFEERHQFHSGKEVTADDVAFSCRDF